MKFVAHTSGFAARCSSWRPAQQSVSSSMECANKANLANRPNNLFYRASQHALDGVTVAINTLDDPARGDGAIISPCLTRRKRAATADRSVAETKSTTSSASTARSAPKRPQGRIPLAASENLHSADD